jgi:glyoxylase-like metal-dependent hydrolase (beta-lactamase superfamily II)
MENFAYLVGDRNTKECFVVDPAWDADVLLKEAQKDGMKVIGGLLTHTHYDHANATENLIAATGGKVYVHKAEADFLKDAGNHLIQTEDGFSLSVGSMRITFLHTPGHTPGAQCLLVEESDAKDNEKYLISGDTLFVNACGRCDLPGSDPRKMYESLNRLAKLGDDVSVLPGHDYGDVPVSSIGRERQHNPYMKAGSLHHFLRDRMGG